MDRPVLAAAADRAAAAPLRSPGRERVARLARRWLPPALAAWLMRVRRRGKARTPGTAWYLLKKLGNPTTVLAGPFQGLRYTDDEVGSVRAAKILGAYERDLHPALEAICAFAPDRVINVGAAEGYYAVGLARRLPGARVVAFEGDPLQRHLLGRLARHNGVAARVVIAGYCRPEELGRALSGALRPAVLCDCEGYELVLLDPERVAALRRAMVLVETHDFFHSGISDEIRRRFAASHRVTQFDDTPRTAAHLPPGLPALAPDEVAAALGDARWGFGRWLLLEPLEQPGG